MPPANQQTGKTSCFSGTMPTRPHPTALLSAIMHMIGNNKNASNGNQDGTVTYVLTAPLPLPLPTAHYPLSLLVLRNGPATCPAGNVLDEPPEHGI